MLKIWLCQSVYIPPVSWRNLAVSWRNSVLWRNISGIGTEKGWFFSLFFLSVSLTLSVCLSVCLSVLGHSHDEIWLVSWWTFGLMTEFRYYHNGIWLLSWRDFDLMTEFGCFSLFPSLARSLSLPLSFFLSVSLRAVWRVILVSWRNLTALLTVFRYHDEFRCFSFFVSPFLALSLSLSVCMSPGSLTDFGRSHNKKNWVSWRNFDGPMT